MSVKKVKQLEELVFSGLQCLEKIYYENGRLEERIWKLEKEKETLLKESDRVKGLLDKIRQLEVSLSKLKTDCSASRAKIKIVLQKIDKMDFI